MRYTDIDTSEGYWGDDDGLTRDGDTSGSDLPSVSSSPTKSDSLMTDASATPPAFRLQRDSGFKTPSKQSRFLSHSEFSTNSRLEPLSARSSTSFSPSPTRERVAPSTPASRSKYIRQAFQEPLKSPQSPTPKRNNKPVVKLHIPDTHVPDFDEEQEVSMILTDTEPNNESPPGSSSTASLGLGSEDSFSSVGFWARQNVSSRKLDTTVTAMNSRSAYPARSLTAPIKRTDSLMSVSGTFTTPRKVVPLPPRAESMPIIPNHDSGCSSEFFRMPLGVELETVVIEHDHEVQKLMDSMEISWGVQYELARGVSVKLWTWREVTVEKLDQLKGLNIGTAHRVAHVMRNRPLSTKIDLSMWKELDREQDAILENVGRGLGLMGAWKGDADWYGGRIQQIARLYKDNNKIEIKLEPMEMRRSHRFARYCGSRRILQVRIPDDIGDNQDIRRYLCNKFVLCGRVFVPLHAKEGTVYLVETNDDSQRKPQDSCGDQCRRAFADFINWHNPLHLNKSQPISKWSARFALGLSNSVPVLEFQSEYILFIEDEVASGWDKRVKPPSEKIMTDGCGFINRAAMVEITRKMGYSSRPTAVQGRICGAKGLWVLDPYHDMECVPRIWIRASQNKIKYENLNDRSHRIFELLCASQPSPPIALSQQTILNLFFNNVPEETLTELLVNGITEEAKPLMNWGQPMPCLWHAINKIGHVSGSRAQRLAAGKSRALGLTRREWGSNGHNGDDAEEKNIEDTPTGGAYTGRNEHSGAPLGLQEFALELVQAGFRPTQLQILRDKIRYMIQQVIKSAVEKYCIPLSESLNALVVPDPLGVLKEGQIYYRSSQSMKDPETETLFNVLKGEVLVGRYPVRLPSDVQKVIAVDVPELYEWSDVIITPVTGDRSPASILSGGDELFIIREQSLVKFFENKPFIPEPQDLQKECFNVSAESLDAFGQRTSVLPQGEAQREFQFALLSGLNDAKVGLYSRFHEYAICKFGYSHKETVRMAYMFSITLDSGKTGLRLKSNIFEQHRRRFSNDIPGTSDFILNRLIMAGKRRGDELLKQYDRLVEPERPDPDLKSPYEDACTKAEQFETGRHDAVFREELGRIREHVDKAHQEWLSRCRSLQNTVVTPQKKKARRSRNVQQDDPMQRVSRMYAEEISGVDYTQNVEMLKASCAYHLNVNFAFAVAFRVLCDIKARASIDGSAPSIRIFDELKSMAPFSLKALEASQEDPF
ncbi:hypothetical protein AX17_000578 [Amanita inopinata Kibby_2008]|nr:hypothetical protein AX17_000578 [Amanita inopinata Kibby_2008]